MLYLISISGLTSAKNIFHMGTKSFSFYQLKMESMLLKKIICMFGPETPSCSLQYQTRYAPLNEFSVTSPPPPKKRLGNNFFISRAFGGGGGGREGGGGGGA